MQAFFDDFLPLSAKPVIEHGSFDLFDLNPHLKGYRRKYKDNGMIVFVNVDDKDYDISFASLGIGPFQEKNIIWDTSFGTRYLEQWSDGKGFRIPPKTVIWIEYNTAEFQVYQDKLVALKAA